MKDSDEKEKRISHLKDIMSSVRKIDAEEDEYYEDDKKSVFKMEEEYEDQIEPLKDDFEFEEKEEEIIEINEIDDEFIFNPSKSSQKTVVLKDNEIDEDFIVKTTNDDDNDVFPEISDFKEDENGDFKSIENTFRDDEVLESEKLDEDDDDELYNQLNKITTLKIKNVSFISILGIVLGVVFIISAIFVISGGSDRIVDNVVSGEVNGTGVFLLFIGIILLIFSTYKGFSLKNPFGDLASSIDNLEKDNTKKRKKSSSKEKNHPTPIIEEPPIDRDSYKIGEFDIASIKSNLKKPTSKVESESYKHTVSSIKKDKKEKESITKKTTIKKTIETDGVTDQSIDDIFEKLEEVEDIETSIPIVSIDEKVEKSSSKKDKEE
ncbi:hypothetical protein LJB96_01230 [Methanobrevibacter sp. OttesenSCG-928-K11]|nr:hypothetical protein [Methanobrevibacter sp. OttesenSCG-928-K11]MDL2270425.1 hypothetical protein [Methanobrevibacter sp. OttesenSCG-928-I08]